MPDLRELRATHFAKSNLDKPRTDTYRVRALDASTRNATETFVRSPRRATKVGSLGRFYRLLSPFLPKFAPSSCHDELGARLGSDHSAACGHVARFAESGYRGESRCSCVRLRPARRWIDREFCALSKRLPNARGLREVSARTGCGTRTQHTAWSVVRRFTWCRLPWATPPLRLPAGTCTRVRASRAPSSSWRDEERVWARMG